MLPTQPSQTLTLAVPEAIARRVKRRHAANRRFRLYGMIAVGISIAFLFFLLSNIITNGYTAFFQTQIRVPVTLDANAIDPEGTRSAEALASANYDKLIQDGLKQLFPTVEGRMNLRLLYTLPSKGAGYALQKTVTGNPSLVGTTQDLWIVASSDIDMFRKGRISADTDESLRKVKDIQIAWIKELETQERIRFNFNTTFFVSADSRSPELAGVWGSVAGSFFTVIICIAAALPLAVMTAVYLEEFAPKNRFTDLIEVNINNLAAVPSIVFGLLGLAIFLGVFGMPRSSAAVGGVTLSLMVLPTIVITTRNALKAVPPSIRDGAAALGASPMQVLLHHTLPLAMPGIMTGTILGISRALGETAPLLMIGMVAFISNVPTGFLTPATTIPVQIFLWADSPELGFVERTSAAILILLAFLITANGFAIYLRKKYETRW
ncbi:MAG: phosphate transporter rane protein 2, PhoT family [Rickettsiales bacterium]|jgi:phosphate transport system permease protein|nr:phosphate transporter rane protein 2, PhoT family [Rickettsiales bacterium]